jgi:hypothetical protein
MAPSAAAGSYRLRTEIQRRGGPPRRGRTPVETPLSLTTTRATMPALSGPAVTFTATVSIPGYTRAGRGRSGQSAAWWPIAGDSVVVQFVNQQSDIVQLRGKLESGALRGEVWYHGSQSGTSYQLGTFAATKSR